MSGSNMMPHVVVFGELTPRARVQYTRFLLDNHVKFRQRPSDGRFVANVRLALRPQDAIPATEDKKTVEDDTTNPNNQKEESPVSPGVERMPPRLRRFANLLSLAGERDADDIKDRPVVKEARLLRRLHEIYDARFEEPTTSIDSYDGSDSFARFVRQYLTNRFGLKKIVDQQMWELVDGLSCLQHRLDVDMFSTFLEGKYSDRTLTFFLTARAYVQRLLSASSYRPTLHKTTPIGQQRHKTKSVGSLAGPAPTWLSKSQLEQLASLLFGAKTEDGYQEFTRAVTAFVSSQPEPRTAANVLEVHEFLLLAIETHDCIALDRPSRSPDSESIGTPVSTVGAVASVPPTQLDDGDVQVRLDSLLERARQRRQQLDGQG